MSVCRATHHQPLKSAYMYMHKFQHCNSMLLYRLSFKRGCYFGAIFEEGLELLHFGYLLFCKPWKVPQAILSFCLWYVHSICFPGKRQLISLIISKRAFLGPVGCQRPIFPSKQRLQNNTKLSLFKSRMWSGHFREWSNGVALLSKNWCAHP